MRPNVDYRDQDIRQKWLRVAESAEKFTDDRTGIEH